MKTYLALAFSAPGDKPGNGGDMEDWKKWMGEMGDKIVDAGSPLANGVESSDGKFSKIKEDQWPAQGYMMIQAENIDAAAEMMKSSPLGDTPLRIFEKVDMPEMG